MTRAEARRAAREARKRDEFRKLNFHMLGTRHRNCGTSLTLGAEWDTPDGFRVRQVEVVPNPAEAGHFLGTLEVIDYSERMKS